MKVAILGAAGLLGRYVAAALEADGQTVSPITRQQLDLSLYASVKKLLALRFDWIVNCAGVVKCLEGQSPRDTVLLNAALPHWLEYEARRHSTRLLHISTDCVFSGAKGSYNEDDPPDPVDLYGASKLAGEVHGSESLTLRCSFVGLEHGTARGLLAWLIDEASAGRHVKGYTNALWNGLSTPEVARVVVRVLRLPGYPPSGLYHVAGGTISKCDLLMCLSAALRLKVIVEPVALPMIDRTLSATRFRVATGYSPPTWNFMAQELAEEWRARR